MLTEEIIEKILNAHNEFRLVHNARPLKYSVDIGDMAQKHALHLSEIQRLEHSSYSYNEKPIGENLARWNDTEPVTDGIVAVRSWYSEVLDYNFHSNLFQPKAGHFTQLVWKETEYLGFGLAKSEKGDFYAVAFYYPAGNFESEYFNNVGRLEKSE